MTEDYNLNQESDFSALADTLDEEPDLQNSDLGVDSKLLELVEVQVEQLDGRQRRISAQIPIPYAPEKVWQVLTNYDALSSFIPNLSTSRRLPHPEGKIRLEQVGSQRLLRFNFSARVVLEMEEQFPQEIRFTMVEGDFNAFHGAWQLTATTASSADTNSAQPVTYLRYTVTIWPKRTMPVGLVERRIRSDLPLNLLAIRQRTEQLFS